MGQADDRMGSVTAIAAQERVYYALAGHVAVNNCFNARVIHAALGNGNGMMIIPNPEYVVLARFGSLELKRPDRAEDIGKKIDYADAALVQGRLITIDWLALKHVDLPKIDVEGMEDEVLDGARRTIRQWLPVILIEHLKTGQANCAPIVLSRVQARETGRQYSGHPPP
jgi:FkbM family methyltransferase